MSDKNKEERRAEDQDAAIETAFAEGTLPDHDRREPEAHAPTAEADGTEQFTEPPAPPEVIEPPITEELPEIVPEVVTPEQLEVEQKPIVHAPDAFPPNIRTSE